MIISNSMQFVYIHLHKCAGTSVERALAKSLQYNDILIGSTEWGEALQPLFHRILGLHKHSPAIAVQRLIGDDLWQRYFTFATVRHPFDLAISQYRFSLMLLQRLLQLIGLNNRTVVEPAELQSMSGDWRLSYPGVQALLLADGLSTTFSDFIRSPQLDNWGGFEPMTNHLSDGSGRLLVDDTFKVEELGRSWGGLLERIGVETPVALDTHNTTRPVPTSIAAARGRGRRGYYRSADDVELIRQRFSRDFEEFGYVPELSD